MRKGFDGLCGRVRSGMKRDPLSGDVFVFINRRRTHINNGVERAMRTVAIGRKNDLFCGSHRAAEQMATFYTLLATCRLHGVNPETWLEDVLPRIAAGLPSKEIHLLLPHQ